MKKLLSLGLVLSAVALTGCSQSAPTLEEVESVIDRIDEFENVVITRTDYEEEVIQISKDIKKAYEKYEEITTYEFSDGKLKYTVESITTVEYGSNYSKEYEIQERIYDFENGYVYSTIGNLGFYTKNSTYGSYNDQYEYSTNLSFLNYFMGDEFITSYEKEGNYSTDYYNIYTGGGFDLTYTIENVENDDEDTDFYYYSASELYTYTIEFKDSNIKVPSEDKVINF